MKRTFCSIITGLPGMRMLLLLGSLTLAGQARADYLQMVNGDRYAGKVISMGESNVVFQSEMQGAMDIPRDRVATIYLRPVRPAVTATNTVGSSTSSADVLKHLGSPGFGSNLVQQVRQQFLSEAGPEANQQFDEMISGLMSGKISVADIQEQARDSVKQLRSVKSDLGEDGEMIEGYLAILESFLGDEGSSATRTGNAVTNSPARSTPAPSR